MKYLDEYRDPELAQMLLRMLERRSLKPLRLMEICGTHTVAIFRSGLRELLPATVRLISGPGCPVCVTAAEDIDKAIWLARQPDVIVTTFGDLLRVPGSVSSLHAERAKGADVRLIYASFDALQIAREHPERQVVLLGIGFETTAPTVAAAIKLAASEKIANFSVFSAHKLLPPAMEALLAQGDLRVDGFLCPGHVTTVIGAAAYREVARRYRVPCVVAGFEPLDILQSIAMLVEQIAERRAEVAIQYRRAVSWEGNRQAQAILNQVFEPVDAPWRGLGVIPLSGLGFRESWRVYDARERFAMPPISVAEHPGCRCGEVLRGVIDPPRCRLFRQVCTPEQPLGPCMVSAEGTCGAYYRYHREDSSGEDRGR
jgi:hydrogenase expression/formation protein HypD